jgi:hypothetical protein
LVIPNILEILPKYPSLFCFSSVPSSVGSLGSHERNLPGAPGRFESFAGLALEPPPPALTVLANDITDDAPLARPSEVRLRSSTMSFIVTSASLSAPVGDTLPSTERGDCRPESTPPPRDADRSPTDARLDGAALPYGLVLALASDIPSAAREPALPRLFSLRRVFFPTMEASRSSVNGDLDVGECAVLPTGEGSFCRWMSEGRMVSERECGGEGHGGFRWTRAGAATVVGVSNTSRAAC